MEKKNKDWTMKDWLIAITLSIAGIFAPVKVLIIVSYVLIFSDLITGLIAAKKRGEWKSLNDIRSSGLGRTFSKIGVCSAAICLAFLVEHFIIEDYLPLSKLAAAAFAFKELKSILENLDVINGNPVYKSLVKKLGSVNDLQDVAEKIIDESKPEEKPPGESL